MKAFSAFFFFLLLLRFIGFISPTEISLSLHEIRKDPSPDQWMKLQLLVSASVSRAKYLKNYPQTPLAKTPLFPHSYGGYSIFLNFGSPPQKIPLLVDTGSDLVWFPCTRNYVCRNCTLSDSLKNVPSFLPKMSSSSKLVGCRNPKCSWIHKTNFLTRCQQCDSNQTICSQICPPYAILYGSGSTSGVLLSETLVFPEKAFTDFGVGCSLFSSKQPAGIAGFGRGSSSLPSQLHLRRFSYCLVSHRFDDTNRNSSLVLNGEPGQTDPNSMSYTPLLRNPVGSNTAFSAYYYVNLRKITIGGRHVKIPFSFLEPGVNGNGGTVVDSGTTFTFMESGVFELVVAEFEEQVKNKYKRAVDVEAAVGLRPCFDITGAKTVDLPQMIFHFKGGGKMKLPLANYFSVLGDTGSACLTMVTTGFSDDENPSGPSIILGNFQQQNYYIEYDLEHERLGFRPQIC